MLIWKVFFVVILTLLLMKKQNEMKFLKNALNLYGIKVNFIVIIFVLFLKKNIKYKTYLHLLTI